MKPSYYDNAFISHPFFMLRTLNKMFNLVNLTAVFHCFHCYSVFIFPHLDLSVQYNFGSGHVFLQTS